MQRRWLLGIAIASIGLLVGAAVLISWNKRTMEAELRTNGTDMMLLAAYRDSTLQDPNHSLYHQRSLRLQLLRSRPTPYRGSLAFVDSLGLWSAEAFLRHSRSELRMLGRYQSSLFERIEQLDTAQTLVFAVVLSVTLLLIPLLLLYHRLARQRLDLLTKLQASEVHYRELVEHMPDLIQSVDAEGRFVYVNHYWRQVMGYSDEDLSRLRIWDILRPDQLPKCQLLFEKVFREQSLHGVETVFLTKHGEELHVSGNITVRPDPLTGRPVTRALFRDVTAQKRQLQLLQYQEALANTVARIAQQLLATLAPETLAPAVLGQLGETLNTDTVYLVALPEGSPQVVALWVREEDKRPLVLATFESPCWESLRPFQERLGAVAVVEATAEELPSPESSSENCLAARNVRALLWSPLTRHGHLWGFIGTEDWRQPRLWSPTERTALESTAANLLSAFDRTHAYRELQRFAEDLLQARTMLESYAEELRKANEELQERNAEKDRIMAIVSHDLRSPLSGIRGLAEILQTEDAKDPALVQEFAKLIHETADHMLALINDLLEVTRFERGALQLRLAPTDLCELARSAFRTMEGMARSKNIRLVLECPDTPLVTLVDAPKLTQALNNLLSNAIKFTHHGGSVTVRIQTLAEHDAISIQVEDTGIGIPEEFLPHLFQKFGPHQRPGTGGERGTGLGLPIIKAFVELHGGSITVTSTVGVGTCFTIQLPYRPPTALGELSDLAAPAPQPAL